VGFGQRGRWEGECHAEARGAQRGFVLCLVGRVDCGMGEAEKRIYLPKGIKPNRYK